MSSAEPTPWRILAAAALVALAAAAAWSNSLHAPFVFDDILSIPDNPSIRRLWPIGDVLAPSQLGGLTISGRPLLNLSLALNYAIGGLDPFGYHLFNLGAHILAGLVLFGVTWRTLARMPFRWLRPPAAATNAALFVSLLWTLHPLQTESVTYVIQRGEVLMGLFYLLTLYGFIRGVEVQEATSAAPGGEASPNRGSGFAPRSDERGDFPSRHKAVPAPGDRRPRAGFAWFVLAFLACLLGMVSKEVMVSAPLMVFLFDRTFVAGTFREAWRRRWPVHLALAGTWLLLAWLMAGTGSRGGTVGFDTGVSSWHYLLTQCRAVVHYLRLALWPHPLVFDYGEGVVKNPAEVWPQALLLLALVAATVTALWRRPVWGFLGFWLFAVLAPSSSFVPLPHQTLAEHRMYLPLVAVVAAGVAGLHLLAGRRTAVVCLVLAVGLGATTLRRNHDYRTDLALWSDTVAKVPVNPRAREILGDVHAREGRWPEAIAEYRAALQAWPGHAEANNNLGIALLRDHRTDEALVHFEQALRTLPDDYFIHRNLGVLRLERGELAAAIGHFEQALRSGAVHQLLSADAAGTHRSLAEALMKAGRMEEAATHWTEALRLQPDDAQAHYNLGLILIADGRPADAVPHLEAANHLQPGYPEMEVSLGVALVRAGRVEEAISRFKSTLRTKPKFAEAEHQLGLALVIAGRLREALPHFERFAALLPDDAEAKNLVAGIRSALDPGAPAGAVGPK